MTTSVERATFLQDLQALQASSRRVGMIVAPIGGMSRPGGTTGVVPAWVRGGPAGDVDVPSNGHVVEVLDQVDDGRPHHTGLPRGRSQRRPAAFPERARRLHELRLTRAAMDWQSGRPTQLLQLTLVEISRTCRTRGRVAVSHIDTRPRSGTSRQEGNDGRRTTNELLSQREVAVRLGVSARTVEGWRARGVGPPYLRLSARAVRYRSSDLEQWLDRRRVGDKSPLERSRYA